MKNLKFNHVYMLIVMALSIMMNSCQKEPINPKPIDLPGTDFQVNITENRDQAIFEWTVENGKTVNPAETIQQLCVTSYNSVTIRTTADVNAESSNPDAVTVTKMSEGNNRLFILNYKSDGNATIKLYNGTGANIVSQTFTVKAIEFVDLECFLFKWYKYNPDTMECTDDIIRISHYKNSAITVNNSLLYADRFNPEREQENDLYFDTDYYNWDLIYEWDMTGEITGTIGKMIGGKEYGHVLTFIGYEPENTSFRQILSFQSEMNLWGGYDEMVKNGYIERGEYPWMNERNLNCDIDDLLGENNKIEAYLTQFCNFAGSPYYMAVIGVKADKNRYYYMYHRADGHSTTQITGIHRR